MIILGLDPATRSTGYAYLDAGRYVECGSLTAPAGWSLPRRVRQIAGDVRELLEERRPDVIVLETPFVNPRWPGSCVALAQIRGALLLVAGDADIETVDYAPSVIKQAVTGRGNASKAVVSLAVRRRARLDSVPSEDATDALAAAYTHASRAAR